MRIEAQEQDGRSLRAQKKKQIRRQEILDAALKLISQKGYQFTTISDIIIEAKISRGTFYLYFQSMKAVFNALIDELIKKITDCIKSVNLEDGQPMQDLQTNIERVIDVLFTNKDLTTILLKEAVAVDKKIDEKLNNLYSFLYRMVRSAIRNGVKLGFLREVDQNIIAMAFIGSIKETLYQCLIVEKIDIDPKKITEELLSFGFRGLKT